MKNFILFTLLNLSPLLFAQVTSGIITYGLSYQADDEFGKDPVFGGYYKIAVDNAKYLSYTLEFNQDAMQFSEDKNLSIGNSNLAFASSFSNCYGSFYKAKNENEVLNFFDDDRFGALIVSINADRE